MTKLICIVCPNGCHLDVEKTENGYAVKGQRCPRGKNFAETEMTAPKRSLTTSVATDFTEMPVVSVRTKGEIPKEKIPAAMKRLNKTVITKPMTVGDVVVKNIVESGVDVIITTNMKRILNAK